jgi:uncharacterized repeat protein (TIGR03803 family)
VIEGADGNFYGTTTAGGSGNGTVFKITPQGTFTQLYNMTFASIEGQQPTGLIQGTDGNFYGTTTFGGSLNHGAVFQLTPGGTFTLLHSFAGEGNQPNGLMQKTDGSFYGTAYLGGSSGGYGTIFRLSMGLSRFVKVTPGAVQVGNVGRDLWDESDRDHRSDLQRHTLSLFCRRYAYHSSCRGTCWRHHGTGQSNYPERCPDKQRDFPNPPLKRTAVPGFFYSSRRASIGCSRDARQAGP